ncbi:hypothetical protein BDF19DRAFT_462765 [Syncephalis fuscata]|nr:hypothetical protein BDF19DRAFT_462765 [Syncephalis fuscata]
MKNLFALLAATATIILASSIGVQHVEADCKTINVRREIRELSDSDRQSFFDAIKKMQAETQPNKYDEFINIHITYSSQAHGVPAFLPWHQFQKRGTSVPLPYWDWAADSQAPEVNTIFRADWFGTNGKGSSQCVTDGQFKDYRPYYPTKGSCFSRAFDGKGTDQLGAFYGSEFVAELQSSAKDYDTFRRGYEGTAHARVHNGIGASFSHMSSPSDLVFWMHHSLVDKHWAEWQALGHQNDYGPTASSEMLVPWNIQASATFNTKADPYCYTYSNMNKATAAVKNAPVPDASGNDDLGDMGSNLLRRAVEVILRRREYNAAAPAANQTATTTVSASSNSTQCGCKKQQEQKDPFAYLTPDGSDRTNILGIRVPKATPEWWCKMNNISYSDTQYYWQRNVNLTKVLNGIPGYISKSALFNRPDVLSELIKTTKEFVGYLDGKQINFPVKFSEDPLAATSPDTSDLVKRIGADAVQMIQGYNGGVSINELVSKAKDAIQSATGKNITVPSANEVKAFISQYTGN